MSDYEFTGKRYELGPESSPWETFQNHREIITSFLKRQSPVGAENLCVLGAGLCNDLELNDLIRNFNQITLVDIKREDVLAGVHQQNLVPNEKLLVAEGQDLTGIHELLLHFQSDPSEDQLDKIFETARNYSPEALGKHHCIASTCLLSQLLCHATECIGEDHSRFVDLLKTIRLRHIEIMVESLLPGGVGFLFTDVVSSESLPELYTTNDLKETVKNAIAERNFLHGLNPQVICTVFDAASVRPKLKSIRITDPWRWVVPKRIYACFAIIFELQK